MPSRSSKQRPLLTECVSTPRSPSPGNCAISTRSSLPSTASGNARPAGTTKTRKHEGTRRIRFQRKTDVVGLFATLRDHVRQVHDDAVVVLRLEGTVFVDANLRGGHEITAARSRSVHVEQDEAEIESGGGGRCSSKRDRLGGHGGDLPARRGLSCVDVFEGGPSVTDLHAAEVGFFCEERTRRWCGALLERLDERLALRVAGVMLDDNGHGSAGGRAASDSRGCREGLGLRLRDGDRA